MLDEPVPRAMTVRYLPAVYGRIEIPKHVQTDEEALEYAKSFAKEHRFKVCLSLNRRVSYLIEENGNGFRSTTTFQNPLNRPYMELRGKSGKLNLSFQK